MVLVSLIFFALLLIIPILSIEKKDKILFTTVSFIIAEVLFYTGGFLLGKEIFNKYRSYLNPKNWRKHSPDSESQNDNREDHDQS